MIFGTTSIFGFSMDRRFEGVFVYVFSQRLFASILQHLLGLLLRRGWLRRGLDRTVRQPAGPKLLYTFQVDTE